MTRATLALLLLGACDDHLFPAAPVVPDGGYEASWGGVETFFVDQCDQCHLATSPLLHEAIPDDVSNGDGFYVVPGDPDASVLWQSLSHTGGATPMPFGSTEPLTEEAIGHVRDWIADGALLE